ncbi:MAG: undecaprenyl-diphosphatase [Armatimonadota bacterium]|nr:undecaprenyl-diphosphatase [Armatimonadota bacterium]
MPPTTDNYTPYISYLQALILGLVQGVTEFLPVSSTAHMRILPALLNHYYPSWPNDTGAAFSAIAQLGPMVGIIAYFRHDLARYIAGLFRSLQKGQLFPEGDQDARLAWYVVFATIPIVIAGLRLEKSIDTEYRNLYFIAVSLIVLALILLAAELTGKRTRRLDSLTLGEALGIGLSQALAVIPGTSRSGVTITTGLFLGLDREEAARFSFLLSVPAITLAGLYKLLKTLLPQTFGESASRAHAALSVLPPTPTLNEVAGPYIFAAVVAGIFAYIVVRWLLGYLSDEKHSTMPFIIYRIVLGLALIYLVHLGIVVPQSH